MCCSLAKEADIPRNTFWILQRCAERSVPRWVSCDCMPRLVMFHQTAGSDGWKQWWSVMCEPCCRAGCLSITPKGIIFFLHKDSGSAITTQRHRGGSLLKTPITNTAPPSIYKIQKGGFSPILDEAEAEGSKHLLRSKINSEYPCFFLNLNWHGRASPANHRVSHSLGGWITWEGNDMGDFYASGDVACIKEEHLQK